MDTVDYENNLKNHTNFECRITLTNCQILANRELVVQKMS